ncbi:SulP family inorganic anion transporter [Hahella ganghwensis]|uniref:SulP family inorganic anion transporter n=1 Tax=Hahella ganghwensis TaxID=286420 RepID=UPI00036C0E46|nr:SulP family inorganic anion transporter [Hahella ganghwensis]
MTQKLQRWLPWLNNINPRNTRADVVAAITGASLAIPQGVAFASIAGLPPEYGFYCALVAPVIAILLGSSWHMVCGPTTAISALLFATLQGQFEPGSPAFIQAVITVTFLAGLLQLALGILKFGSLTNFVSHAVMVGFITGAALLIILSQIRHLLQIELPRPEQFLDYIENFVPALSTFNPYALAIGLTTLVSAVLIRYLLPKAPHYLIGLLCGSLLGYFLKADQHGVSLVGELPGVVPPVSVPNLSLELIRELAPGAVALALVGLLEAVSIARAISLKTGQKIDANREFIGQAWSNIGGSFFSSYMSSGSFTRSGVNVESGARTPLAVLLMTLFLFLILYFVAPLFAHLPIPAMAGVIILVGWRLIAFNELRHYMSASKEELAIAVVTLTGCIGISLEFGLYCGVGLSIALFLNKTAKPYVRLLAPMKTEQDTYFHNIERFNLPTCPQINFIRMDGPIYFGSVEFISQQFNEISEKSPNAQHWVLLCRGISNLDMQGAHMLRELILEKQKEGKQVHLVIRYVWQLERFRQFGLLALVGNENIYPGKGIAIKQLVPKLQPSICATCNSRIFNECPDSRYKTSPDTPLPELAGDISGSDR